MHQAEASDQALLGRLLATGLPFDEALAELHARRTTGGLTMITLSAGEFDRLTGIEQAALTLLGNAFPAWRRPGIVARPQPWGSTMSQDQENGPQPPRRRTVVCRAQAWWYEGRTDPPSLPPGVDRDRLRAELEAEAQALGGPPVPD